jgi:hypothetical protein
MAKDYITVEVRDEYRGMPYWVVINGTIGFRCGYVGVPDQLYKKWTVEVEVEEELYPSYGPIESQIDCHGGITFNRDTRYDKGLSDIFVGYEGHVLGFDCGHAGDGYGIDLIKDPVTRNVMTFGQTHRFVSGSVRSKEYCIDQCKSMIDQLWEQGRDEMYGVIEEVKNELNKGESLTR